VTRIFLANVGVNSADAQDGLRSPIFGDGTFEFVPIRETAPLAPTARAATYASLHAWSGRSAYLDAYVPKRWHATSVHADPEFDTFTYGDDATNGRAANLRDVRPGDELWFLSRLWAYDDARHEWTDRHGRFYLVGYLAADSNTVIDPAVSLDPELATRLARNAHLLWASGSGSWPFRVIAGTSASRRFRTPLEVTPEVAGLIYGGRREATDLYRRDGAVRTTKTGSPLTFKWFHSNTRAIQCWLDADREGDAEYIAELRLRAEACGSMQRRAVAATT
jgi:hypothetical protein